MDSTINTKLIHFDEDQPKVILRRKHDFDRPSPSCSDTEHGHARSHLFPV